MTAAPFLEGQLNDVERNYIFQAVAELLPKKPACIEVGTDKGGGSTLQILQALAHGEGLLFGIEASQENYAEMTKTLLLREPGLFKRCGPSCGFSQKVIPALIAKRRLPAVDFAFLDGGNNPREQITEFKLLDPLMPVGSALMAHDVLLRKGKWLRRFLPLLDHYETRILPISTEGLLVAKKIRPRPSTGSKAIACLVLTLSICAPLELVSRLTPSWLCAFFLKLLPRKLSVRIAEGRTS